MAYKDLREWIDKLEAEGELKRITAEIDWNGEMGALGRAVLDMEGPALLFENIKDYKDTRCTKVFAGGVATGKRLALMFGLPKDTPMKEQLQTTRKGFSESIKPVFVDNGPVKENILRGDEIDLYEFPVPFWHPLDGGRYINTAVCVVTKDPETGWVNIGTYGGQINTKDTIGVALQGSQHWGLHFEKYKRMGKPMPVAFVLGWDPCLLFTSASGIKVGISEYDVAGAIRQEPVPLVNCETVDLPVPASAEIVIEGLIDLEKQTQIGPWADHTGHYAARRRSAPVCQVECVTHRNDPILISLLECWGPGHPNEDGTMMRVQVAANVWNHLELAGVPGILDVCMVPASANMTCAVQIHKSYEGQAKQVAACIFGSGLPSWQCKYVIVGDEDIDIHNLEALEWAMAYQVNPDNDIVIFPGFHANPLDPSIPINMRKPRLGTGVGSRVLFDATKSWIQGPQDAFFGEIYPPIGFKNTPEDEELVKRKWKEWGF